MSKALNWCFTLNNYTDDQIPTSLPAGVNYLIFGKEIASTGTPHLQGFVSFSTRRRQTQCTKTLFQAHWTVCRSIPDSINYCKKDGDFTELGIEPPTHKEASRPNVLNEFMASVRSGTLSFKELREAHPSVCARYPRFVESYVRDNLPVPTLPDHPYHDWQKSVLEIINQDPDDRTIYFFVDAEGGKGKSWFTNKLAQEKGALVLSVGKKADLAHILSKHLPLPKTVIFDVQRSKMEHLQYDVLEALKDGRILSTKYDGDLLYFKVPHVLVFSNENPVLYCKETGMNINLSDNRVKSFAIEESGDLVENETKK